MIQQKLRATKTNWDSQPGTWQTPINPDGEEAAQYIQNMIESMGHIIKIALDHVQDEDIIKQIERHAYDAIKGSQNKNGAVFRRPGTAVVRSLYRR